MFSLAYRLEKSIIDFKASALMRTFPRDCCEAAGALGGCWLIGVDIVDPAACAMAVVSWIDSIMEFEHKSFLPYAVGVTPGTARVAMSGRRVMFKWRGDDVIVTRHVYSQATYL